MVLQNNANEARGTDLSYPIYTGGALPIYLKRFFELVLFHGLFLEKGVFKVILWYSGLSARNYSFKGVFNVILGYLHENTHLNARRLSIDALPVRWRYYNCYFYPLLCY